MSELTGEQLTEKFFTEVKGWNLKPHSEGRHWRDSNDKQLSFSGLPPLHLEFEGLGLQEKWVWPELRKKGWDRVEFYDGVCTLQRSERPIDDSSLWHTGVLGKTRALAQIGAALKALGVI